MCKLVNLPILGLILDGSCECTLVPCYPVFMLYVAAHGCCFSHEMNDRMNVWPKRMHRMWRRVAAINVTIRRCYSCMYNSLTRRKLTNRSSRNCGDDGFSQNTAEVPCLSSLKYDAPCNAVVYLRTELRCDVVLPINLTQTDK